MKEFIASLSLFDIALLAGAAVAIIGLILALLSPKGRDKLAALGLRVADALVALLERLLSDPALLRRLDERIDGDVDRTLALDKEFAAALAEPDDDGMFFPGVASIDLDTAFENFREARRDAEREIFKDTLWAAMTEQADD